VPEIARACVAALGAQLQTLIQLRVDEVIECTFRSAAIDGAEVTLWVNRDRTTGPRNVRS
jgi:hypothetical protein